MVQQSRSSYNALCLSTLSIRTQIQHCLCLSELSERHAAAASDDARGRLLAALRDFAAAEALRHTHARRQRSLVALAGRERALHAAFDADRDRAAAAADARAAEAAKAAAAAAQLRDGLDALQAAAAAELERFRSAGDGLRLDIAADAAAAFRVAHGAAHLEEHYAKELLARADAAWKRSEAQYQQSAAVNDTAEMRRWSDTSRGNAADKRRHGDRIEGLEAEKARMEELAAGPWALLRRKALGGPAEAGAAAVRVRTSAAHRAAWGGEDRALERPEEWNRAMSEEADRAKAARLLVAPP